MQTLVERFEAERPRLRVIAQRMLGSAAEADDIVQEAWLRLDRTDPLPDRLPAWLTTVVSRLCLDQLRSRKHRHDGDFDADREGGLPLDAVDRGPVDPEAEALLADQVGAALLVVLDTLSPAERVAYVLHDLFALPFDQVSTVLGRTPAATRQLASRARRAVQGVGDPEEERRTEREVVDAFLVAARGGDLERLLTLLAPDAVMQADAVGAQMGAEPVFHGAEAVAARFNGAKGARPVTIDGRPAAAWVMAKEVKVAFLFVVEDGLITGVDLIGDPATLALMDIEVPGRGSRRADEAQDDVED